MDTMILIDGLSPLQTWGLIALVVLALFGVWSLLTLALDSLNEWLNVREYEAQYRINEARQHAHEERQLKGWPADQDDFKSTGWRMR